MATRTIYDMFDCRTLHIIGGSQEFLFLSLFATDIDGVPTHPIDLSRILEIEWLFAPFSVIKEKNVAMLRKRYTTGEIIIIRDGSDGNPNRIQVTINAQDTKTLRGAFHHQIVVTDGAGTMFVPFEGIININKRIQVAGYP